MHNQSLRLEKNVGREFWTRGKEKVTQGHQVIIQKIQGTQEVPLSI